MLTHTLSPDRDPLGAMLTDYMDGRTDAFVRVDSTLLEMSEMTGDIMFRNQADMNDLETTALSLCRGRTLDVGAGSGCHSLALQAAGFDVTAMDISPGCIDVMERRGVEKRLLKSLFSLKEDRFNTLLMLMNGIGICGTIEGLNFFFQHIRGILTHGGQVLADSTDLTAIYTNLALIPGEEETYYGETEFTMTYGDIRGEPFEWLYIDYATLAFYAEFHGWRCEQVLKRPDGKFLARIY
ncbi:MAG: methyltransferase domain-containing protein [Desulfobacterales bacterium]|nr:methyltransferase domain-containing protein [Desulfobacterales bacterium]